MPKKIIVTDRAPRRIVDISAPSLARTARSTKSRKVSAETVAKALGAEVVGKSPRAPLTPLGLIALGEKLSRMIKSTGGRPALEGFTERQKIPLQEGDWQRLKKLVKAMTGENSKPTPGQLASVLLHEAIVEAERLPAAADREHALRLLLAEAMVEARKSPRSPDAHSKHEQEPRHRIGHARAAESKASPR